jgi:hypothetical protein
MILGEYGLDAWKVESNKLRNENIRIAREACIDTKLNWGPRIRAMAISDDVDNLKPLFASYDHKKRRGRLDQSNDLLLLAIIGSDCIVASWSIPKSHPFRDIFVNNIYPVEAMGLWIF